MLERVSMRFLVRLSNERKFTPKDARELTLQSYGAVKGLVTWLNNM